MESIVFETPDPISDIVSLIVNFIIAACSMGYFPIIRQETPQAEASVAVSSEVW